MARKEAPQKDTTQGGANEVLGIGLFALAVLFLLALFSYDKGDLSFNGTEVNDPRHNLVGLIGAWLAQGCFLALGVAAYLLPPLTLVFAFGFLINKLDGTVSCRALQTLPRHGRHARRGRLPPQTLRGVPKASSCSIAWTKANSSTPRQMA